MHYEYGAAANECQWQPGDKSPQLIVLAMRLADSAGEGGETAVWIFDPREN
jgi:hypothetical protein